LNRVHTESFMTEVLKNLTSLSIKRMYGVVTSLAPLFFAVDTGPPSNYSLRLSYLYWHSVLLLLCVSVDASAMMTRGVTYAL
jgi:hypothetical protein